MNKRVLRKFAIPSSRPNPKNGIFCADQVKYVVRTAIKNIDHQRTLVLYIYAKESVLAGNHTPRWTMFQQKGGYITLCTDDKGTRWQQSMFENLGKDYFFRDKCSFYSQADERRVTRYCQSEKQKGFESLCLLQLDLLRKKQRENELKKQQKTAIITLDGNDLITSYEEKPKEPKGNLAVPPFYCYRACDVKRIQEALNNGCGYDAPGSFAAWLSKQTPMHAYVMPGKRYDIGDINSYEYVKSVFLR